MLAAFGAAPGDSDSVQTALSTLFTATGATALLAEPIWVHSTEACLSLCRNMSGCAQFTVPALPFDDGGDWAGRGPARPGGRASLDYISPDEKQSIMK